ncbi:hypothetical protein BH09PSE6_BH09PSE6_00600 [soil metagenome]
MLKILLQTTIEANADDWDIDRFSLLRAFLESQLDADGRPSFDVTARNREAPGRPDPVLLTLDRSSFDQLWLFAVDTGQGLAAEDCEGITRFRQRGGGLMVTRDHMDLGSSVCSLGGVGAAHHFHTTNPDPDEARRQIDDPFTTAISWPNYHSGANGDFQRVAPVGAVHAVLLDPTAPGGIIEFLPSHPHEGSVSAPRGEPDARVILQGTSKVTGGRFNIAVAFEQSSGGGRAIAQSTFHHFVDLNWNPDKGAPSFVSEVSGDAIRRTPAALQSTQRYVRNVAEWLGRPQVGRGA